MILSGGGWRLRLLGAASAALSPAIGWAQVAPSSDLSITSVGYQQIDSASVDVANGAPATDIRFFLGQRLRWTLGHGNGVTSLRARALADARFTLDPKAGARGDGQNFETNHVRQLGVELVHRYFIVDLGRHPVYRGGPRLVDGVQVLFQPTEVIDLGFWAGLAPDFFETDFRVRPGFGPILAYSASRAQVSVVGDVAFAEGGLDRAGVLAQGRVSSHRRIEAFGRVDLELSSAEGGPHLTDLQLYSIFTPSAALRFDALYNAFSSYQYLTTADLDPEAQRFQQRLGDLGRELGLVQIRQDPTINHLVGATVRYQGQGPGTQPRLEMLARYRHNADPANRYLRLSPTLGLIQVGGRLDVLLNATWLRVDAAGQLDAGLNAIVNATDTLAFDASVRALTSPEYSGFGFYVDTYVDFVWQDADLVLLAGLSYLSEPDLDQADGGPGLFVQASKYLRHRRRVAEPIATDPTASARR